ncbi:hypothetical protein BO94DRAFT_580953 [Aspergillus sclerotioniger CBS 115572]|uniref:BZIP domain-containing protein n=1 Tax=Aspergillus sclerotioniger CBS 115572 TaxID=1450535 RepID=A0A317XDI9_9EURO|nr:hypothetical protein BO94DRAFT_580953 [Aspergillus sclerotioniger CBS 115572]PWY95792.1 hypothetical protein BO94DRAFT_580953 [Aspergillus sclerotioniger CBS 115572]
MEPNKNQKNLDRLARIRENQRNSRARKLQHTRELEQKLAALQEQARLRDVEHRLAMQKLEAENRKLRHLLTRSGLASDSIEKYLHADDLASTEKLAIPNLRRPEAECQPYRVRPCSSTTNDAATRATGNALDSNSAIKPESRTLLQGIESQGSARDTVCGCAPNEAIASWPSNEDVLNTTLCAIADELIDQYNTRGVDMEEIRRKLWAGFSKGLTTEEGCRVQNHILFQVLDEISNS